MKKRWDTGQWRWIEEGEGNDWYVTAIDHERGVVTVDRTPQTENPPPVTPERVTRKFRIKPGSDYSKSYWGRIVNVTWPPKEPLLHLTAGSGGRHPVYVTDTGEYWFVHTLERVEPEVNEWGPVGA